MPDAQTYSGSCHCGAVTYTVEVDPAQAMKCNCSICTRLGAVWARAQDQVQIDPGGAEQGDYQFNKRRLHHRFCTELQSPTGQMAPGPTARPRSASICVALRASTSKS
jgi:hypothetical protein